MDKPDLTQYLTTDIIGQPYERWNCYGLTRYLYRDCLGIDLPAQDTILDPGETTDADAAMVWMAQAVRAFRSVWEKGADEDPIEMSQPWDTWLMRGEKRQLHVATVINEVELVHSSKDSGVCRAQLRLFRPSLSQVLRYRQFA